MGADVTRRYSMIDSNLLFRRQFVLTDRPCPDLAHWTQRAFDTRRLYVHPDVELTAATSHRNASAVLIGYALDPAHPERSNRDVLDDLLTCVDGPGQVARYLRRLSGRFVLVITLGDDTLAFHDPCGLRSVFYVQRDGRLHLGSQPSILQRAVRLEGTKTLRLYQRSQYSRRLEAWLPAGCGLYKGVGQLLPNHFLRLSTATQQRYWPDRPIVRRNADEAAVEAANLLRRVVLAARARFELALPLTAGRDSRLILAACRDIAQEVFYYTLQYRELVPSSWDIAVPAKLLRSLGLGHHVIDCRQPIDPAFAEVYAASNALAQVDDWGTIASAMRSAYPDRRVCLKGNCAEICRCAYYKTGKHAPITNASDLVSRIAGGNELPFVLEQMDGWFSQAQPAAKAAGMDILDLFYWEHRMGSWQAQSQREWDLVQETFSPFNHRQLLETMLGVPVGSRCAPDYALYHRMFQALWPAVLCQPLNPPSGARSRAKRILLRLGLKDAAAGAYRAMRRRCRTSTGAPPMGTPENPPKRL